MCECMSVCVGGWVGIVYMCERMSATCVLEVGGWSEICAIAKCVRRYAGVSIQCFFSISMRVYNF